ncbi:MAG: FAD-binding protein, partial [Ferruginibacter sp.]
MENKAKSDSKKQESTPVSPAKRSKPDRKRQKWQNCVRNQIVEPMAYVKPQTLEELLEIIKTAGIRSCKVKAVGAGHSFSDIVQTTDYLINCHFLDNAIELEEDLLKSPPQHPEPTDLKSKFTKFVHVESGMTIRRLNKYLDSKKLALINMGAYDGQTISGVISTSTHGTGISLGPIASSVASLIVVGEKGDVYRIEPSSGITDPIKYKTKYPGSVLIQDNDCFNAMLVSMGCMGVFYSVILKVSERYYLSEERYGLKGENY